MRLKLVHSNTKKAKVILLQSPSLLLTHNHIALSLKIGLIQAHFIAPYELLAGGSLL